MLEKFENWADVIKSNSDKLFVKDLTRSSDDLSSRRWWMERRSERAQGSPALQYSHYTAATVRGFLRTSQWRGR
eukprot:3767928-Heterocapsa_arctica.AAC.1